MSERQRDDDEVEGQWPCPEKLRHLLEPIDSIRPHPHNMRVGHNLKLIAECLRLGWHGPIVTTLDGEITVHNGCWLAAKRHGQTHVPVLRLDDDEVAEYRRMFLDNRSGEFSIWDPEEVRLHEAFLRDLADATRLADILPGFDVRLPGDEGEGGEPPSGGGLDGEGSPPSLAALSIYEVSWSGEVEKAKALLDELAKVAGVVVREL